MSAAQSPPDQSLRYVDAHTHLDFTYERLNFHQGWSEFKASTLKDPNLEAIISNACEVRSYATHELYAQIPDVFVTFGLHPHNAKEYTDDVERQIFDLIQRHRPKAVAWGEMGLDYHYDLSPRDQQRGCFVRQLRRATELHLPIVIHTREADEDTLAIFRAHVPRDTLMHVHCYTGGPAFARTILEEWPNACIGFTGIVSFRSAKEVHESVRAVPLERMLLETDAPYMAPVPFRGKICHSAMIPHTAAEIAKLKGVPVQDVYRHCRENTRRIYGV